MHTSSGYITMKLLVKLTLLAMVATAIFYIHGESLLPFAGDQEAAAETRSLGEFNSVHAGGATDVHVRLGERHEIEVIASERLKRHIRTDISGDTLTISRSSNWLFPLARRGPAQINVTLPVVNRLSASGASTLRVTSALTQAELRLQSSGSSDLHVTAHVEQLVAQTSGSSDIHISGSAEHADIQCSGSSDFRGRSFSAQSASVRLSGSSDAWLTVYDRVSGTLSGSSDLHLAGAARVEVSTSGSSSINRLN